MKSFDAVPHTSLGPVRIGAERAEVHKVMGAPEKTFKKTSASVHPTDAWFRSALQVFYTPAGTVEFIEVSGNTGIEVVCFGEPVFSTAATPLVELLAKSAVFTSNDGGYTFVGRGIDVALWRPDTEAPEGTHFSTFGLGAHGYYA
jgi:hypothetical protein